MAPTHPAHPALKAHYRHTLEACLAAGLIFHLAVIFLTPPMLIAPYEFSAPEGISLLELEVPPEIIIPELPKEVSLTGVQAALASSIPDDPIVIETSLEDIQSPFDQPALPGPEPGAGGFRSPETMPKLLKKVTPVYPTLAREAGAEGTVMVLVTVNEAGRVTKTKVVDSDAIQSLRRAAIEAAEGYLFSPAKQGGIPVQARILLTFDFRLR